MSWKAGLEEALARRHRFLQREMQDAILATLPVATECARDWEAFEARWGLYPDATPRPFPSNEEIYERTLIGLEARSRVADDWLPVVYSILDAGESMVGGMFGQEMRFWSRRHAPAYSLADPVLPDYAHLEEVRFCLGSPWAQRFLGIQRFLREHTEGRFAQHPCLTMDALNFACEMRGASQAYLDIYEHPDELHRLLEIGLDFNIRFQEAQQELCGQYAEGSFCWLSGWVPCPRAVSLSVDAYVACSPDTYLRFGFDYQRRLLAHFGHGLVHFHCTRTDLARVVAQLPGLMLFQFGGDEHDPVPDVEHLPAMRAAVGNLPLQVSCATATFLECLAQHTLQPNVWYCLHGDAMSEDEANRLMEQVRAYRA